MLEWSSLGFPNSILASCIQPLAPPPLPPPHPPPGSPPVTPGPPKHSHLLHVPQSRLATGSVWSYGVQENIGGKD